MEKMNVNFEMEVALETDELTTLFGVPEWKDLCEMGQHVQRVMGVDLDDPLSRLLTPVDLGKAAVAVATSTELTDKEKTIAFVLGIRGLVFGNMNPEKEAPEEDDDHNDE